MWGDNRQRWNPNDPFARWVTGGRLKRAYKYLEHVGIDALEFGAGSEQRTYNALVRWNPTVKASQLITMSVRDLCAIDGIGIKGAQVIHDAVWGFIEHRRVHQKRKKRQE